MTNLEYMKCTGRHMNTNEFVHQLNVHISSQTCVVSQLVNTIFLFDNYIEKLQSLYVLHY